MACLLLEDEGVSGRGLVKKHSDFILNIVLFVNFFNKKMVHVLLAVIADKKIVMIKKKVYSFLRK